MDSWNEEDKDRLASLVSNSKVVHIYGAGLNSERPAHTAVAELKKRGWAVAPIHPKDGGATIDGFPIRPALDEGVVPEIVVLFLAPERARAVVRNLIMRIEKENFPLVWFQLGAEDEASREALESMGVNYVQNDCLVRFTDGMTLFAIVPFSLKSGAFKLPLKTATGVQNGVSIPQTLRLSQYPVKPWNGLVRWMTYCIQNIPSQDTFVPLNPSRKDTMNSP